MSDVQVTVQEMDELLKKMFEKRTEIDALGEQMKGLNAELAQMKGRAVTSLKELGRDSYKTEHGTIAIVEKWRVGLPQNDDDKEAFFTYLKEKGGRELLYKYATVNSNSLNSFFLEEWEEAKQRGDGMTYRMPGVPEPKLFEDVSMRKR